MTNKRAAKNAKNARTALQEYEAAQENILILLKQIKAGVDAHDRKGSTRPGGHHWGHVGDLKQIQSELKEVSDRLHGKGEYAELAR